MLAHYLPRCYLNAFTVEQRLHVFDRDTGKLRRDTPKNVAAITDYYILTTESGEREERVEHGLLANLEASASPVLRRLANCEAISDEEHDIAATFLAFLCTRIPAFEETYAELNDHLGKEAFRRAAGTPERAARFVAEHPKTFPYSAAEFCAFVNSDALSFPPVRRERIRLMIEAAEPLIEGFKRMDWWLWRARGTRRFVTSDAPFGLMPLPGALPIYGELSSNVLRFLAISPDTCLMLADQQRELPFLTAKDLDDDGVREVNAAISLGAVRLVIARDRNELEKVLDETGLRSSSFRPRTKVVSWDDAGEEQNFGLDVRIHHDTEFPLEVPVKWTCRNCATQTTEALVISYDLTTADPRAYTDWLDRPCATCGRAPRQTQSPLGGEDLVNLNFPPDA